MEKYNRIRELDDEIHKVFEKYVPKIFELIKTIKIPNTTKTMFLFISKTNFIKTGIYDLYESQNLYSMNILFRSLIEHYLRFLYIFFRICIDKNDNVGDDYIIFSSLCENIDTGKAWKDIAKILDKEPALDPYDLLKDLYPEYKQYTKQEIIDKSSQFRYKNIIKFINNNINKENDYKNNIFLLNLIPYYSDLSSFVHGGPSADQEMIENYDMDAREKELIHLIELTFHITASVKSLSFLIWHNYDKQFGNAYLAINEIIKDNF